MSERIFIPGGTIVIRGMEKGEYFDPKTLKTSHHPRFYIASKLTYLIGCTAPFTGVGEIKLLSISVDNPNCMWYNKEYRASLAEVEKKDFFKERIELSPEEFFWVMINLISLSDDPKTKNPPLLNHNAFTNCLIDSKTITLFQLMGLHTSYRSWLCERFNLEKFTQNRNEKNLINKILIPCR